MTFVASKVLWTLAAPANALLLLLSAGLILCWTRWRRAGIFLISLATLAFLAIAILPVSSWLYIPLENRFSRPERLPESIDGIVLLGGATVPGLTAARGQPALNRSAERVTTFVALARRYPEARLVFTGGSGSLTPGSLRQADVVRELLAMLGLDVSRVTFERDSRNTAENARYSRELVKPQSGETWLLITSANHMPRAVGCFRRVGWNVTPYPVDYQTSGATGFRPGFNFGGRLNSLNRATHEWIGLIAYRLLDRTTALLPGPER